MREEYFYLIYRSKETCKLSIAELEELTQSAARKNAKLNVTGLLIRENAGFIQYLEGGKTDVVMLYESILKDRRHSDIVVLDRGSIEKRRFGKWSMQLKFISTADIKEIETNRVLISRKSKESLEEINRILAFHLIQNYQVSN